MKKGENIIQMLMRRDGVSRAEATQMYKDTRAELMDAIMGTNCLDPEEVLAEELGIEPDYIFDFI